MDVGLFLDGMARLQVDFFTGVPDSLLKPLCDALYARFGAGGRHIVAANEGAAASLAAGHYIATGRPALVYLQNSGIGNAVNPMASLLHPKVYGIPCVFAVGWRGEPGVHDEPQHVFQGDITPALLKLMDLRVFPLGGATQPEEFQAMLHEAQGLLVQGRSVAFLMHKDALSGGPKAAYASRGTLLREEALRAILQAAGETDVFVSTTGKTSREVWELREASGQGHGRDFLTVGSMGHASMIALGIARERPQRTVWCLEGDGAALMHLGSLAVAAQCRCGNLIHVVLNNGAHESVGGMPVAGGGLSFVNLARAAGFEECFFAGDAAELAQALRQIQSLAGKRPCFLEIALAQGSRPDLGRPKAAPQENLKALMEYLGTREDRP